MPNFCKNSSILVLVTGTALLAIFIELMSTASLSIISFALTAVYLLWVSLGTAALLCFLNHKRNSEPSLVVGVIVSFLIWLIVETITQFIFSNGWDINAFLRRGASISLVLLVLFRVFALLEISNNRARLETQSRLSLLQSKMAPHFLFNSLNTIAELTYINPRSAEQSIVSLSKLLRATLDESKHFHSLVDELELCDKYLELEKWRLGERLIVKRQYNANELNNTFVPKLTIQPLIENAIIHGIVPSSVTGELEINIEITKQHVNIQVANTISTLNQSENDGIGLAIKNIKERLFVIYDDQQKFHIRTENNQYKVNVRLPLTPPNMVKNTLA